MISNARRGLSIAEVSRLLGVPVPTIRSWEKRYRLPPPPRSPGGHRRYRHEDVARLRALRDDIVRGHPPREAAARLHRRGIRRDPFAQDMVSRAVHAALEWNGTEVRAVLEEAGPSLGVERTVASIALPLLREVGDKWFAGECDVGQEHLATQEVRDWIARMRALATSPYRGGPVLLACAPDCLHSVALEAFALILARRRWDCRVLGAGTPVGTVLAAVRELHPVATIVSCEWTQRRRAAGHALKAIDAQGRTKVFYGGGAFTPERVRRRLAGSYLGEDMLEAADALDAATRVG